MPSLPWVTSMASSTRFTSARAGWGSAAAMSRIAVPGQGGQGGGQGLLAPAPAGALPQ